MNYKTVSTTEYIAVTVSFLALLVFVPIFVSTYQGTNIITAPTVITESQDDTDYTIRADAILDFETIDFIEGEGKPAQFGDTLYVHYVGHLEDGTAFDSSIESEEPFEVTLGNGDVITGWEIGLIGMEEGGTRRLVIPSELGYGEYTVKNSDGDVVVPANATLTFDIVLLKVN